MPKIENESAEQNVTIIWPVLLSTKLFELNDKHLLKKPLNITIQSLPTFAAEKTGPLK